MVIFQFFHIFKHQIGRLPVFYEFQVGPMLSSPAALPLSHILLKPPKRKRLWVLSTKRITILIWEGRSQRFDGKKHSRWLFVFFWLLMRIVQVIYQEEQWRHQLLEPLQLSAHACLKQFLLLQQFDQISVSVNQQHTNDHVNMFFNCQHIYVLFITGD